MSATVQLGTVASTPVHFVTSMLGFAGFSDFELEPLDQTGVLFSMNSVVEFGPRMFVLDPGPFFPSYSPELDASVAEVLDCAHPSLLVVVTAGEGAAGHTANLLAPIAFNPETGAAMQVVLDDDSWPLRAQFG